jgi:hypothetical protein
MIPAAIGTATRRAQDREMIEDPLRWPQLRLPLKNPARYNTERPAFGFLEPVGATWGDDPRRPLYLGNIFSGPDGHTDWYDDVDALLDDGWTVD